MISPNSYQIKALDKEADQGEIAWYANNEGVRATKFTNGVIGLMDECGELSALRKRWLEYQSGPPEESEVLEECGDALWRIGQILSVFNLTMEQAMEANLDKLYRIRYKDTKCNPHSAAETNRDRKAESEVLQEHASKLRAEDDGVAYEVKE